MRLTKSLRWRLQIWHALVLFVVLTMFGGIVYGLQWQTRMQQIDADLEHAIGPFLSYLRRLSPGGPGGPPDGPPLRRGPPGEPPYRGEGDERRPRPPGRKVDDRPSRPVPGADRPEPRSGDGERQAPLLRNVKFPPEVLRQFEREEEQGMYFNVWNAQGELLERSAQAPVVTFPALAPEPYGRPIRELRTRDNHRELAHASPFVTLLVGRSLEPDLAAQRQTALFLGATGFGVLAVGLFGGWWLSGRAIRPVAAMSAAASSISAKNLSTRIDVQHADNELGQLGQVLNQTFDRLQAAFEQQIQFTADASHELRTPLAVVQAQCELALSKIRSPEEYRAALETCRKAGTRMHTLVESLLLLARMDSGEWRPVKLPFELHRTISECVELLEPLAQQRSIQIAYEPIPVQIEGDAEQLGRVITNLLSNAIRYNNEGGRIDIRVESSPDETVVQISDTGLGIPAEHLSRIFERFYRVDPSRSRQEGGLGLGLAICKSIVELHGGTIAARDNANQGTTFEIRLPAPAPH